MTARQIASSPHFDKEYYSKQAGVHFTTGARAVKDFLLNGETKGLKPSPHFDPVFYREANLDLAGLGSVFLHYIQFGADEGRVGSLPLEKLVIKGERVFNPSWPSIVIITHELSETGAPILAWNIINNIPAGWNVICVSLQGGPLKSKFMEKASAIICLSDLPSIGINHNTGFPFLINEIISKYNVQYVISNSAVSERVASMFAKAGAPVLTLIHEFASYIPRDSLMNCAIYSEKVIFSSKMILVESERKLGFQLENAIVAPQGKSIIPNTSSNSIGADIVSSIELESEEGKYIVIGCGHVQIRKGVDLFIAACHIVAQKLGKENVRFAWVGNGYEPDTDYTYSLWLKDQVERSGLTDCFSFIPGLGAKDLDKLYSIANVMFLSSRLDPLPNVAIDAISIGLPVICFADATGFVECFENSSTLRFLIAPYLDVQTAAQKIIKLLCDQEFTAQIRRDLIQVAETTFSMQHYVEKLLEFKAATCAQREMLSSETDLILNSGVIESETILRPGQLSSLADAVEAQVRMDYAIKEGAFGGIRPPFSVSPPHIYRRPFIGFSPHIYFEQNKLQNGTSPTADWIRKGRPDGPWRRQVVNLSDIECPDSDPSLTLAIHIHAHYSDQLRSIVEEIALNNCCPDIIISGRSATLSETIHEVTEFYPGKTVFVESPNSGRDIGPMLTSCAEHLKNYDVVGHIHTKKSLLLGDSNLVNQWVAFLLGNCISGAEKSIDKIAGMFSTNPKLGLCFPEDPNIVGWTENLPAARELLESIGVSVPLPKAIEFPVGNMFYFRPTALLPLLQNKFTANSFPPEPLAYDGTMLHAIERLIPIIVESQGFEWVTTRVRNLTR